MGKYPVMLVSSCKYLEGRYVIYLCISYSASLCELIFKWECLLWKNLALTLSQESFKAVSWRGKKKNQICVRFPDSYLAI